MGVFYLTTRYIWFSFFDLKFSFFILFSIQHSGELIREDDQIIQVSLFFLKTQGDERLTCICHSVSALNQFLKFKLICTKVYLAKYFLILFI